MFYAIVKNGDRVELKSFNPNPTGKFCGGIPTYMVEFHSFDRKVAMEVAKGQHGDGVVDVVWHCCDDVSHVILSAYQAGQHSQRKSSKKDE